MAFILAADVVSIAKTDENFRLLYDAKGRFVLHRIKPEEARVSSRFMGCAEQPLVCRSFTVVVMLAGGVQSVNNRLAANP